MPLCQKCAITLPLTMNRQSRIGSRGGAESLFFCAGMVICGRRLSANECKHNPKQSNLLCRVQSVCVCGRERLCSSRVSEEVQHGGLQIVSEGTDGRHQPVRAEAGVCVHHAFRNIHLWRERRHRAHIMISDCGMKQERGGDMKSQHVFLICHYAQNPQRRPDLP